MADTILLFLVAGSGVISILLYSVKTLLDQSTEVSASWYRAKRAWRDRASGDSNREPSGDDSGSGIPSDDAEPLR